MVETVVCQKLKNLSNLYYPHEMSKGSNRKKCAFHFRPSVIVLSLTSYLPVKPELRERDFNKNNTLT